MTDPVCPYCEGTGKDDPLPSIAYLSELQSFRDAQEAYRKHNTWTPTRPTVPGWYWLRWQHKRAGGPVHVEIVQVSDSHGVLYAASAGQDETDTVREIAENCNAIWSGPLQAPPLPEGSK